MKKLILLLICVFILSSCGTKNLNHSVAGKCSIEISCENILDNISNVKSDIKEFIPSDGIILKKENIEFYENESAFELLLRVCKENKIKLLFSENPGLDSKFVTEINNIKSGDAGDMSGWIYYINNESLTVAADDYIIKNGDSVKWYYVCDMSVAFSE